MLEGQDGHQAQGWNTLLGIWTWAQENYGLADTDGAIDQAVKAGETQYWEEMYPTGEERDISQPRESTFLDYVGTIKWLIIDKFNALKADEGDAAGLGWDDIVGYVQNLDANQYFTIISAEYGDLSGGHGKGTMWWVGDKNSTEISSGSVPENTHGTSEGALGGARGAVRTAISGYNACIDAVVQSITWPLGY